MCLKVNNLFGEREKVIETQCTPSSHTKTVKIHRDEYIMCFEGYELFYNHHTMKHSFYVYLCCDALSNPLACFLTMMFTTNSCKTNKHILIFYLIYSNEREMRHNAHSPYHCPHKSTMWYIMCFERDFHNHHKMKTPSMCNLCYAALSVLWHAF